jgi:purine-nucleoside phosphorylase
MTAGQVVTMAAEMGTTSIATMLRLRLKEMTKQKEEHLVSETGRHGRMARDCDLREVNVFAWRRTQSHLVSRPSSSQKAIKEAEEELKKLFAKAPKKLRGSVKDIDDEMA